MTFSMLSLGYCARALHSLPKGGFSWSYQIIIPVLPSSCANPPCQRHVLVPIKPPGSRHAIAQVVLTSFPLFFHHDCSGVHHYSLFLFPRYYHLFTQNTPPTPFPSTPGTHSHVVPGVAVPPSPQRPLPRPKTTPMKSKLCHLLKCRCGCQNPCHV